MSIKIPSKGPPPQRPGWAWIRTCQECNHEQEDVEPTGEMTRAYEDRLCRKCKSESLDYGSNQPINSITIK